VLVKEFADAATLETIEFVNNLFDVFELQSLDPASSQTSPVSSSRTLILGAVTVLGLIVGAGLALFLEYYQLATSDTDSLEIIDYESGIYNRAYFMLRLREEITRSRRNQYTFALALVEIVTTEDSGHNSERFKIDVLRKIISVIGANLREEDVITRYDKTTLSLLLPDRTVGSARDILMEAQQRLSDFSLRSSSESEFHITAGITSYQVDVVDEDVLLQQATEALKIALDSESHQIQVYIDDSQSIAAESVPSSALAYSESD
jgi:diguanylate cyclase (GGDEF)-like protein